jgi:hypothetical protein
MSGSRDRAVAFKGMTLLLAAFVALFVSCKPGSDEGSARPAVRHPLAIFADRATAQFTDAPDADVAIVSGFCETASPLAGPEQVSEACGALGRCLVNAEPDVVARFVIEARGSLTSNFFHAFGPDALCALADSLSGVGDMSEAELLAIECILRQAQGAYSGNLAAACRDIPFADTVVPRPVPLEWLMPAEDAPREVYSGAASVLRSRACVKGGARPDLALRVYQRALDRWPEDPTFVAGMASLLVEMEERGPEQLMTFLDEATVRDPENAAWLYLKAARHFRAGLDDEGLLALSMASQKPKLTFHGPERARRTAAFLESLGYTPIRARLVAYRLTSTAPILDLKLVGSKALLRSYEYEDEGSLRLVLELPSRIDHQLDGVPRMLMTEQIRLTLLSSGLPRLADFDRATDRDRAKQYQEHAERASEELARIEKGEALCGGMEAWGAILARVGDERFLRFLSAVLAGGEAEFLTSCSEKKRLEECLESLP